MFRVEWLQSALNELAAVWLVADSEGRQAVTRATNDIDRILQIRPEQEGESREGDERVMFSPPLGINFIVDLQAQVVTVFHIWSFQQHQ